MNENKDPFYSCPRYQKCSVNNCPLHPGYPNLYVHPEDPEQKCKVEKTVRLKISAKHPGILKYDGLTLNEFNGKKRWDSLSIEEQEKRRENMRNALLFRGINSKGVQIPQAV